MADKLDSFLQSLNTLSDTTFPIGEYVNKLVAAGLKTDAGDYLKANLSSPVSADDAKFNGRDCSNDVCNLMVSSAVRGLAEVNDSYGFHGCADAVCCPILSYAMLIISRTNLLSSQSRVWPT